MHGRLKLTLAASLLGSVFTFHVSGCSLIGYGIGSLIDNSRATHYHTSTAREFFAVSPGTPVVLHLRDSTTVAGRYRGWRDLPDSVYAPRYEAWRASLPESARPPRLGEDVVLADRHRKYHGAFAGFGLYTVRLELTRRDFVEHAFDDLASARIEHGRTFGFDSAAAAIETGRLPMRAELTIAGRDSTYHIDGSTIATVTLPVGKHARQVGLAVGVFADVFVVAAAVSIATYKPDYGGCEAGSVTPVYLRTGMPPARGAPVPSQH
jgi:hypothetical protein